MQLQTSTATGGPRPSRAEWGSDLVVEMLGALGIPYIALNPGSSYRGIHDSLVNFGDPNTPEMVVTLHEEIAIAVAHGYARATGRPLAAAVHNVVGLQHASMAIYNAWCDRVPMLVIGGTGPIASDHRRNHIDWVHTANVQGNIVRDWVKWDDQPASLAAISDSMLRAYRLAMTEPSAPVYLCFDVDLQEQAIEAPMTLPDPQRFAPPAAPGGNPDALRQAARLLNEAQWPVILADGVGRHPEAVPLLVELAELLAMPVVSTGARFNIATTHPLDTSGARAEVLGRADVVLALDVFDLCGALGPGISPSRQETQYLPDTAQIVHISLWDLLQHSLISDYERLNPVDIAITADTSVALPQLSALVREAMAADSSSARRVEDRRRAIEDLQAATAERRRTAGRRNWDARPVSYERLSAELWQVVNDIPWTLVNGGTRGGDWQITQTDQLGGGTRGAGLGQAAGAAVGGALAFKGSGRLPVAIIGDGDMLYTPQSLWTAAHSQIPLLTIVNNNRSYGNDEGHQEFVARVRGRAAENKGVGIFIEDPNVRFARLAESFDVEGFGPVEDPNELRGVLQSAADIVMKEQRPALVEVVTQRRTAG